ncbi:MAG TPA: arsenite methyltransferase [Candidatus Limnocylindrales bacterium]|nr:arsenite methyltransferase [Candidatus Limnocylindrales bacterium]
MTLDENTIHDEVRARYAEAAVAATARRSDSAAQTSCCGPDGGQVYGDILYTAADRAALPDAAVLASLGCGNPTAVAELKEGERVLDLGSGGGIDVILSARRVGPTGKSFGLDMTDEMLELAVRNAAEAGVDNVEFVRGTIESVPLPSSTIDVVISNCVINLAADKAAVFREIARVLRPGGRVGVSDIVADDALTPAERAERGSFAGCIAGSLSFAEFRAGLAAVGLQDVEVVPTHAVADGLHAAIIRAVKPLDPPAADALPAMPNLPRPLTLTSSDCGCGSGVCC